MPMRVKGFDDIPSQAEVPSEPVRVALIFKPWPGDDFCFDGQTRKKIGMLVAQGKGAFARIFVEFNGGRIEPFSYDKDEDGNLLDPTGHLILERTFKDGSKKSYAPRLYTTLIYSVKTPCCTPAAPWLKPSEILRSARANGFAEKDVCGVLNHGRCPFCGKGKVEEWHMVDPFSDEAVAMFDRPEESGRKYIDYQLGQFGNDELFAGPFIPPGLVAISECDFNEPPEKVPPFEIYRKAQASFHGNTDGHGKPSPERIDLVNHLDPEQAEMVGLSLITYPVTFGLLNAKELDAGINVGNIYKLSLQLKMRTAFAGLEPNPVGSAYRPKPSHKHQKRQFQALAEDCSLNF